MLTESFLSPFLSDLLSVVGFIGVFLTVVGLWLAWVQVKRTTSATEAAIETLQKSREAYNQFVVIECSRLLTDAHVQMMHNNWMLASVRLLDISNLLYQLGTEDNDWGDLSARLRSTGNSFEQLHRNGSNVSPSLLRKWNRLENEFRKKLSEYSKPFGREQG